MHNKKIPKTIQKWIDLNPEKVADYSIEYDEWGECNQGGYSIWLGLKDGYWCSMTECHAIHAATAKSFLEDARFVEKEPG